MKKYNLILGLLYFVMQSCIAEVPMINTPDEALLKESAKNFIVAAVQTIVTSESGKRYFSNVDLKSIELNQKKNMDSAEGWIVRWKYENKIKNIKNPNKNAKTLEVPRTDVDDGILFEIFITYKNGDAMVGRIKNFLVAEKPRVNLAYYLVTKEKDEKLVHEIDEVCAGIQGRMAALLEIKQP